MCHAVSRDWRSGTRLWACTAAEPWARTSRRPEHKSQRGSIRAPVFLQVLFRSVLREPRESAVGFMFMDTFAVHRQRNRGGDSRLVNEKDPSPSLRGCVCIFLTLLKECAAPSLTRRALLPPSTRGLQMLPGDSERRVPKPGSVARLGFLGLRAALRHLLPVLVPQRSPAPNPAEGTGIKGHTETRTQIPKTNPPNPAHSGYKLRTLAEGGSVQHGH